MLSKNDISAMKLPQASFSGWCYTSDDIYDEISATGKYRPTEISVRIQHGVK